jgi:hypothetical protein
MALLACVLILEEQRLVVALVPIRRVRHREPVTSGTEPLLVARQAFELVDQRCLGVLIREPATRGT